MNNIHIVDNIERIDWNELEKVFQAVGWKNHTKERITRAFSNSEIIAIGYIDNRIVGCGRVLTDRECYAAIYDANHPDFQGKGIGKAIVTYLLDQLTDTSFVHLTATTGNEEFYRKLGLRTHKTAMVRYLNSSLAVEYLID